MRTLGETLKRARSNINLTLRQVEESTGISNAYLSQLENDKIKKPSANILYKLSSVYKIELNELLSASGIIEKNNPNDKDSSTSEINQRFAFSAENLNPNQKEEVLQFIEFLKSKEAK
jgi:transcriptional regulator with XRE-family HTH domain